MNQNEYVEFVDEITSPASKNVESFVDRVDYLQSCGLDVPRVLTASVGMANEAGEFGEFVKKFLFQGKEPTLENRNKMKKELGDIYWYFTQALLALGFSLEEVRDENAEKLIERMGGRQFSVEKSENRTK